LRGLSLLVFTSGKEAIMINSFSFPGVGRVSFGFGRVEQLGEDIAELRGDKSPVLLISDAGVARAGIVARAESILRRSGYDVIVLADLKGEPKAETVDRAASILRRLGKSFVVGLGGGSALDTAKLATVIAAGDLPVEDYALCARPLPKPLVKRVMVPTTAGTGSEVTRTAVFTTSEGRKVWTWGRELLAESVVLDPTLTSSLPAHVTATSGIDALVHAIEACTNQQRNPFTDSFALQAIRLGKEHLMRAIENPEDMNARGGMLIAATLAGIAFGTTGTAAAHSIGHALATIAGIPHGRAVAIGMDAILGWNAEASPEAFATVAEALGGPRKAEAAAPAFRVLVEQAGIDRSLADEGIDPETLAAVMMSEENKPMLENNAREISGEDVLELARRALSL